MFVLACRDELKPISTCHRDLLGAARQHESASGGDGTISIAAVRIIAVRARGKTNQAFGCGACEGARVAELARGFWRSVANEIAAIN